MLKQLMLIRKIEQRKATLSELLPLAEGFVTRSVDLEKAIEEATTDEENTALEEEIAKLDTDKTEFEEKKSKLETEIAGLEGELEELNSKEPKNDPKKSEPQKKSKGDGSMLKRYKIFGEMTREAIDTLIAREEVQQFITRAREFGAQTRAVTGADLLVPDVMLDLLRDNISESSKLITKVNYKPLKGTARQNVTGTIPEAVWTEMVGALNELEIKFNQVEVDGYKVGGFVVIPNSTLKDSDINLAAEIMSQLSKAIGMALDKAILYGLGVKQPLGIVTRLVQTSEPVTYPANAPAWVDLHTTNVASSAATGAALIGAIITAFGACKNNFSDGRKFFAMNTFTKSYLLTTLLNFNAAGALATGFGNQMPILGGDIVELDFMTNYDIVGGYGDLYLLVEREGLTLSASEHVKFIEDNTVFKGLARYDGLPVIASGFVSMNINNTTAATTKVFPADLNNPVLGALTVASVVGTTAVGDTKLTVSGMQATGTFTGYKIGTTALDVKYGDYYHGFTPETFVEATEKEVSLAKTDNNKYITVVEFYYGIAIAVGSAKLITKQS